MVGPPSSSLFEHAGSEDLVPDVVGVHAAAKESGGRVSIVDKMNDATDRHVAEVLTGGEEVE